MIDLTIRNLLLADATLASMLGSSSSVYPLVLPQRAVKPCLVYSVNDGIANLQLGSISPLKRYSVTIKTFHANYGDNRLMTERVVTLLNGLNTEASGDVIASAVVHNVFSDYAETHELYTSVVDITLTIRS